MKNVECWPERKQVETDVKKHYELNGRKVVNFGKFTTGKRFAVVEGLEFLDENGEIRKNNLTISHPSSEMVAVVKKNGEWHMLFCLQSRSPYHVEMDGEVYLECFIEEPAGCVEEGQTYLDTAIAELKQELGAVKIAFIGELIPREICRHISYCHEKSIVFWTILEGELGDQELDPEESINIVCKPLDEVKKELEGYLDGENKFFGFEVPAMTLLSVQTFFRKLENKKIDLEDPKGNLLA